MTNMGLQHITLVDDGTLDTVIEGDCPLCGEHVCYRFSQDAREAYGGDYTLMATEAWEEGTCLLSH